MKILYLQMYPLSGSGSGTYARELAREVAKYHTVAMVVPDNKRKIPGVKMYPFDLSVKIAFTGHPDWPNCLMYTKAEGKNLSSNYLSYFKAVVNAVDDFQPDIIHVHHLMPLSWIARFIRLAYGMNFIVTAHGSELPTLEQDGRYTSLTEEAIRRSSRIVPNSYWTRDWMQKLFGNSLSGKIRVIPGGVNISQFPDDMPTADVDKKYKLSGKKVILFSGKLTKYKGVKYLIQAGKNIDSNSMIVIAGDGPERKNLEKLVADLNLEHVKFLGHLNSDDLIKLYYRADVSVVPSIWDEPLGLVVLEAMAAKTPVVVTRKGGIPLMVKEGVNGVFVRPHNAKEIAEKVNMLLKNETLRTKMGQKARETVLKRFTWHLIAGSYDKMYEAFKKKERFGRTKDAGPLDSLVKSIFPVK